MVTHSPLHGSGRAALPHPALAWGDDAQAHERLRVADAGRRKPPMGVLRHPAPRQVGRLTAAFKSAPPQPCDLLAEGADARAIAGHSVVTDMPGNHRTQIGALLRDRQVHASPKFGFHRLELRLQPYTHRLPPHRKPPLPCFRTAVRETEEVEGVGLPLATLPPLLGRVAAKAEQSRFVGMQFQAELCKATAQRVEKPLGFMPMLESNDEIIRKAHHDHIPARFAASPSLNPQIKHIVQVEVGQQRTDTTTLYRSHLTLRSLAVLQHARAEPFLDQPHDAPVRYTMLDELHQPSLIERIEETADVCVEHQLTFVVMIPTVSASSARCALLAGRKPYEKPRKSCS